MRYGHNFSQTTHYVNPCFCTYVCITHCTSFVTISNIIELFVIRVYYCISVKVESCVTTHSPVSIQLSVTHPTAVNELVRVMLTWHTAVNESVRVMLTWHEL
jgi:hypothetical protein